MEAEQYKVLYHLSTGMDAREAADAVGLSYSEVIRLRNKYEQAKADGSLKKLMNFPEDVLPEIENLVVGGVCEVEEGLEADFRQTALIMSRKLRVLSAGTEFVDDIKVAAASLCLLQAQFFPSSGGGVGEEKEEMYKGLLND